MNSITINGPSTFLYAEGVPQLLIWEPGSYSVTVTTTNGIVQGVLIKEFKFVNYTLKATFAATKAVNITAKLHIPFNETSQTIFPKDAWDVNCTEIHFENIWDPANRILTAWALCNYSTTITIENLSPEAVEVYPKEVTENSAKLEWKETTVRDFARYELYLSIDGNNWTKIYSTTEKSNTTYRVAELTPDTTYYFIIRTVDTAGLYKNSQQVTCKTNPSTQISEIWGLLPVIICAILTIILASVFLFKKTLNNKQSIML
jgi:predicted phage tail protein